MPPGAPRRPRPRPRPRPRLRSCRPAGDGRRNTEEVAEGEEEAEAAEKVVPATSPSSRRPASPRPSLLDPAAPAGPRPRARPRARPRPRPRARPRARPRVRPPDAGGPSPG